MRDKLGIGVSLLCLIHCITMPLLITIFPILLNLDTYIEIPILITTFIIGVSSFWKNISNHKYYPALVLFIFGFILISISVIVHYHWVNFIALPTIILAHYLNWRKITQLDGCHPHKCKH